MRLPWVAMIATLGVLTGCGGPTKKQAIDPRYQQDLLGSINTDQYQDTSDITTAIAESARSVATSLEKLSKIERAVHPNAKVNDDPSPNLPGLSNRASVDWSGPVEPLLRQLASAANYRLQIMGSKPGIPILITLTKSDATLAEMVRDIRYQAQRRASIQLYPNKRIIELRYHPV